jgi:signal transduction histidine kinase
MTTEERERFLHNLADDAQRLDRLVRRLLELARADTLKPGDETVDVGEALAKLAARSHADGLRVAVRAPEGPLTVRMAADIFQTVFVNLLDNARQHGASAADVSVEVEAPGLTIRVHDNGPGVSPANAPRVFTPFFTTARDRGGSGIGLSIVKSLVAAHGGEIALAPSERGALFVVRLPM